MVLQGRWVSETFLTLRTFQRSFSTVYPQMYLKVRWLSETIFTPTTLAWRASHYYVLTSVFSSVMNIWDTCHTEYIWRVFLHCVSANGVASELPIQKISVYIEYNFRAFLHCVAACGLARKMRIENIFLHRGHLKGLALVCIKKCLFKSDDNCRKHLSHCVHL